MQYVDSDFLCFIVVFPFSSEKRRVASKSKLADMTPGSSGDGKVSLPDRAFKCVSNCVSVIRCVWRFFHT